MQYFTPKKIRSFFNSNGESTIHYTDTLTNSESKGLEKKTSELPLENLARIQKKRESIFTPELQELVDRIKKPSQASKLPLTSNFFYYNYQKLIPPEKKQEQELLEDVYIPEKNIQDYAIAAYTSYILERIGIHTFSWHFLAYDSNAYFCEIAKGVDITTRKNFLFLKEDPYIKKTNHPYYELNITEELKSDPFFVKKFSPEFLGLYSGAYLFFLDEPGVDACLVAFKEKEKATKQEKELEFSIAQNWLPRITEKLQSLSPAILRYRREKLYPRFSLDDMLTAYMYHLKSFIGQGWKVFYVHYLVLELNVHSEKYFLERQLVSQILSYLGPREKIIHSGIHRYMILASQSLETTIKELASRDGMNVQLKVLEYPKNGENLFLYL